MAPSSSVTAPQFLPNGFRRGHFLVMVGGLEKGLLPPAHPSAGGSNTAKRVQLTRKARPGSPVHPRPDPGLPTPKRWKGLHLLVSFGAGERWARLATFFLALGLVEFCSGNAWNLPWEGIRVGVFWLVSPSEGTSALALIRFSKVHTCAQVDRLLRALQFVRTTSATTTTTTNRRVTQAFPCPVWPLVRIQRSP